MKVRNVLGVAAASVGATVLANRLLTARAGDVEPFLGGDHGTYRWRGFDVAYAEAGDPADPDVLLVHGIHAAASNAEFWRVFEDLAEDHHVIAPDLPGFGQSDRPALLYSASLYVTFVRDAIRDLTDDPPLVVGSSLSGAYAGLAARDAEVAELVLVCPTGDTMGSRSVPRRTVMRSPVLGQTLFNLLASKPSLRHFHADHGYADIANLPAEVLDYEWAMAHQPGARFAPASFVSGFLDPEDDLGDALAAVEAPVTIVWGREADISPVADGEALAEAADAWLVVFEGAKLLPHAEDPEGFLDVLHGRVPVEA